MLPARCWAHWQLAAAKTDLMATTPSALAAPLPLCTPQRPTCRWRCAPYSHAPPAGTSGFFLLASLQHPCCLARCWVGVFCSLSNPQAAWRGLETQVGVCACACGWMGEHLSLLPAAAGMGTSNQHWLPLPARLWLPAHHPCNPHSLPRCCLTAHAGAAAARCRCRSRTGANTTSRSRSTRPPTRRDPTSSLEATTAAASWLATRALTLRRSRYGAGVGRQRCWLALVLNGDSRGLGQGFWERRLGTVWHRAHGYPVRQLEFEGGSVF